MTQKSHQTIPLLSESSAMGGKESTGRQGFLDDGAQNKVKLKEKVQGTVWPWWEAGCSQQRRCQNVSLKR